MKIDLSLDELVGEVATELKAGADILQTLEPAGIVPLPLAQAIDAGRIAAGALTEVVAALGDLEPGPALIVADALQRGLVGAA